MEKIIEMSNMKLTRIIREMVNTDHESQLKEKDLDLVLKHHLDDIREALDKAEEAFIRQDLKEVVDNIIIVQSSSLDVEQLITGKEPKL